MQKTFDFISDPGHGWKRARKNMSTEKVIYLVQYAHKNGFDGWYSIAAYPTKNKALLREIHERRKEPDYLYQISEVIFIIEEIDHAEDL